MSRDWTPEELQAASAAMKRAGQMGYEEVVAEAARQEAKSLIERFAKKQRDGFFPCPRCGFRRMDADPIRNALSRRADVQICDRCGIDEAMEDFLGSPRPLTSWAIAEDPGAYRMAS